ncbi:Sulfite reduction-associated complex DsrMKJOP multiheme protein DsrJ (=HmeF) [hydrothermal vent metagenome]|uniref:Sulfite reduction-associated complex DsrMKJOP multiheme protein DsrJ (=HmeF) n=1 Tax=hydrothermal vent metagenome TaxID=652676 RepID=A0A3B0WLW9_9ZZZZ
MTRFLRQVAVLVYALIGLSVLSTSALIGTAQAETPFPTIHQPSDESKKCIHPEEEMRRNHMNYILHERDETMHEGIRGEPEGLSACIDCHVEPNENGEIAGIDSEEHFCNACHQYASVQIDCFQCHADRPQKYIKRETKASALKDQLQKILVQKTLADDEGSHEEASEEAPQ